MFAGTGGASARHGTRIESAAAAARRVVFMGTLLSAPAAATRGRRDRLDGRESPRTAAKLQRSAGRRRTAWSAASIRPEGRMRPRALELVFVVALVASPASA